ncbi:MAG TPA: hypothetical protein VFN42_00145 [Acetobacteraceae bacterium]|nr:hypothetical protein [Acetobacteraceae bacterium]
MSHAITSPAASITQVSPLVLSDRLIALAQAADRAGYTETAEHLVELACSVFDEAPRPVN